MFTQFGSDHICLNCMADLQKEGPCPRCGLDAAGYEAPPHQLKPGSILSGKYLVGRSLGEGGFGITYIGFDLNLELRVAIKEYYPNGFVTPFELEKTQMDIGCNRCL